VVIEHKSSIPLEAHAWHVERNVHRHPESIGYPAGAWNAASAGVVDTAAACNPLPVRNPLPAHCVVV